MLTAINCENAGNVSFLQTTDMLNIVATVQWLNLCVWDLVRFSCKSHFVTVWKISCLAQNNWLCSRKHGWKCLVSLLKKKRCCHAYKCWTQSWPAVTGLAALLPATPLPLHCQWKCECKLVCMQSEWDLTCTVDMSTWYEMWPVL